MNLIISTFNFINLSDKYATIERQKSLKDNKLIKVKYDYYIEGNLIKQNIKLQDIIQEVSDRTLDKVKDFLNDK